MTNQTPQGPAYKLPYASTMVAAADKAYAAYLKAAGRRGRVMAAATAVAVRNILTDFDTDPAAPFDATHLELITKECGTLTATGRYWTADGTETTFTETTGRDATLHLASLNGWTSHLDQTTQYAWFPLVECKPSRDGRPVYRLDLAKAASQYIA